MLLVFFKIPIIMEILNINNKEDEKNLVTDYFFKDKFKVFEE